MTFPVVAAALLFWASVFMVYFTSVGTTPIEFFFGGYELPPPDLGTWKEAGVDPEHGFTREERYLFPEGRSNAGCLLRQVRYRDPTTRAIVRADPEQRLPRRRVGRTGRANR
jgi:hypothetical protein